LFVSQPIDAHFVEARTEVRYGETDQMGYAHHSVAVMWFELGRVAWLRTHGMSYGELEKQGVFLPVVGMRLKYHTPGRFEDTIVIQSRLIHLGKSRVTFENRVLRAEKNGADRTLLVSGEVELACLDRAGKISRVPESFHTLWKQQSAAHDRSLKPHAQ
jgi:acyl-CoA thioester hydrolase